MLYDIEFFLVSLPLPFSLEERGKGGEREGGGKTPQQESHLYTAKVSPPLSKKQKLTSGTSKFFFIFASIFYFKEYSLHCPFLNSADAPSFRRLLQYNIN